MTELDPYRILGVTRSASREEIARAYRALAKRHHPDVGAPPSVTMARINEAWHVLSDPARRARWDRAHTIVVPHAWATVPAGPMRRPAPMPRVEPSPQDSGWLAIAVVAGVALLVAVLMIAISAAADPDERARFASDDLSFAHPPDWTATSGSGADPAGHRVVVHLVTFAIEPSQECTSFASRCELTGNAVPPGEASIVITAWEGGNPPVPEPVVSRPYGLHADAVIGGQPAVFEMRRSEAGSTTAWWQLSPPGFPDRWIEVRADIGGQILDQESALGEIQAVLDTVQFGP